MPQTTSQARTSLTIVGVGLVSIICAFWYTKQIPHADSSTKQEMTSDYRRLQAIEQAQKEGKHEYSFTVKQAPPAVSP